MHQLLKSTVHQPIFSLPFGNGFKRLKQKLSNLKIVFAARPLESIADILSETFQGVHPSRRKLRNKKQVCVEHVQACQYKHDSSYQIEDFLIINLVYNRLTDFYLEQAGSRALREAYFSRAVVLTPHPQVHALYADKRRLALFSDAAQLQALGVPQATQQLLLEHVPHTEVVNPGEEQRLWSARRGLFFKPVAGFGSRAAYCGDKLTRRVWQDILAGDYVAQSIVLPGERMVDKQDTKVMKFDLRAYAYDGAVQWVAARIYQGQTTNFRTQGGGFSPVYSTVEVSAIARCDPGNLDEETLHAATTPGYKQKSPCV